MNISFQRHLISYDSFEKEKESPALKPFFTGLQPLKQDTISFSAVKKPSRFELKPPAGVIRYDNFAKVDIDVYRGAKYTMKTRDQMVNFLNDIGIKTVINFADFNQDYAEKLEAKNIKHFHLPMDIEQIPGKETIEKFLEIVKDKKNHPIYFHCNVGIERTGLMSALYSVEQKGYTFKQAYEEMIDYGYSFEEHNNIYGNYLLNYCINKHGDTGQKAEMKAIHKRKAALVKTRKREDIFAYYATCNL